MGCKLDFDIIGHKYFTLWKNSLKTGSRTFYWKLWEESGIVSLNQVLGWMGTAQHFFLLICITEGVYTDLLHIIMIFKFVTGTNWSEGKKRLKKISKRRYTWNTCYNCYSFYSKRQSNVMFFKKPSEKENLHFLFLWVTNINLP